MNYKRNERGSLDAFSCTGQMCVQMFYMFTLLLVFIFTDKKSHCIDSQKTSDFYIIKIKPFNITVLFGISHCHLRAEKVILAFVSVFHV